jgi:hypothetical protein
MDLTPDDLTAGFIIATRDIPPALQRAEDQHGLAALIAAFAPIGDVVTAFGIPEAQLVELARQSARLSGADSWRSRPLKRDDVARRNGMMPPTKTR